MAILTSQLFSMRSTVAIRVLFLSSVGALHRDSHAETTQHRWTEPGSGTLFVQISNKVLSHTLTFSCWLLVQIRICGAEVEIHGSEKTQNASIWRHNVPYGTQETWNASIWRHNVPYGTQETWNASIWRHNVPYFSTTKNMEVEYSFPSSNSYSMNQSRESSILHGSRNHFHDRVWNITLTSMNAMELDLNFMEDRS